ncbi:MAG TPA: dUTP diphosphatase [Kofleriaceae bacterium]|nr:dUTP diphosphatase [Kofleriaceae bacterium]
MAPPRVLVKRLRPDAVLPRAMSELAAGMDLCAALDGPLRLAPGGRAAVATGLALAIPPGWEGQVRPRSGLALRRGLTVLNAPGTIDADYRGEVMVLLVNLDRGEQVIEPGERIAQLVVAPVAAALVEEVAELDDLGATGRGAGGFGSTGTGP